MPLQLAFEELGEGPSVVVLHGLIGSGRNWRGVVGALAARHRVRCVDLRNHGKSPRTDSMTHHEMAADVLALIRIEGLALPVVIGHSMGAKRQCLLGGDLSFVEGASGRIAGVISPPAKHKRNPSVGEIEPVADAWLGRSRSEPGNGWPAWDRCLKAHAGALVPARRDAGNARHPAIEPAPGRYVKAKAP